jgi:glycerol-3-phosphate acyltransferase PlsY
LTVYNFRTSQSTGHPSRIAQGTITCVRFSSTQLDRITIMTELLAATLIVISGYFIGTIPAGYIVGRICGVNITKLGSGNIGATNVLRSLGVAPALAVMIIDPLKGFIVTFLPQYFGMGPIAVSAAGLAVVSGNNFSLFLGLRGGKGIATTFGVLLAISPMVALLGLAVALITIALGRLVSLGSLVGAVSVPLFFVATGTFPIPYLILVITLTTFAFLRHQDNLARLANGDERRLAGRSHRER